ncbi:hypothetical protein B0H15DRAFT_376293 [Mycena belliarum]|uniref:Uncharacterized protein n=1 Tax=Mycena belliarum TaxID=1033014 RepID=A0AAD6XT42_9AGAR|nr:hypothetical protein B0H15DRAFT_376293 [Mycena belliae]
MHLALRPRVSLQHPRRARPRRDRHDHREPRIGEDMEHWLADSRVPCPVKCPSCRASTAVSGEICTLIRRRTLCLRARFPFSPKRRLFGLTVIHRRLFFPCRQLRCRPCDDAILLPPISQAFLAERSFSPAPYESPALVKLRRPARSLFCIPPCGWTRGASSAVLAHRVPCRRLSALRSVQHLFRPSSSLVSHVPRYLVVP